MQRFSVVRIKSAFLMLIKVMAHMGACVARADTSELLQRPDANIQILGDTHRLTKRLDLELCLGQFDVHQNTIIRTGESQAIGGKYLQGLELDTMDECQRLCCETESCDVYIFENKNDGYCYLFECGPSENFHCKFTRHANYTSAVLMPAVRRPLTQVTTTHSPLSHTVNASNISQQEWELINLKMKPETLKDVKNPYIPTTGANDAKINPNNLSSKVGDTVQSPQCGRFQFLCHSGECIAVYNACDGIPQCEDGSDEGPECSNSNSNDVAITHPKLDISKANHQISVAQYQPAAGMIPQTAQQQLQSMQQLAPSHYKPSASIINNREDSNAWENHQTITNGQSVQNVNEYHANNGHTLYNQKEDVPSPNGDSFTAYVSSPNTKNAKYGSTLERSGLFVTTQQQQQLPQEILVPSLKLPIPTGNNWQQQQTLTSEQQKQQVQQQQQQQSVANNTKLVGGSNTLQRQTPLLPQGGLLYISNETPAGVLQQQQQQQNSMSAPQLKAAMSSENIQLPGSAAEEQMSRKTSDSSEYEEDSQEKHTEAPKMKKRKHKKMKGKSKENAIEVDIHHNGAAAIVAVSPVHEQYKIIHENLAMEFRDHDGLSDRPSGAVLSLTLGVLITTALAVLIGCRMRTVGRRARRLAGKIPFSHEADFLVNGMYL